MIDQFYVIFLRFISMIYHKVMGQLFYILTINIILRKEIKNQLIIKIVRIETINKTW